MVVTLARACACSNSAARQQVYGALTARLGESLAVLGWNTSMSNLRWQDNYVLVDVDAAPPTPRNPMLIPATSDSASTARWRTRWRPPASAAVTT
jgi:hypothetical protein